MKLKTLYLILLSILLVGCQFGCQQPKIGDFQVIDLSKNHPPKEIRIQDIADIELIPLETTDDVLLGRYSNPYYVSDKYIVINDRSEGIFIFNRQGGIISHFNRRGQGPQEYTSNGRIVFDEKNEEIFVSDGSLQRYVVYSLSGEYKRTLKYTTDIIAPSVCNFDDETLLLYNNDGWLANSDHNYSEKPYMFMSKKDGSIVADIDIRLPVRYSHRIPQEIEMGGQKMFTSLSILIPENNMYYGEDFVIADMSSDTIYRLTKNRELTPILVRTPSVHSSTPQTVWTTMLTTDKFILLYTTVLDFIALENGREAPAKFLMYEFETGQTYNVSFVNDSFQRKSFPLASPPVDAPKNMFVDKMLPDRLIPYYEEMKSKGESVKIPDEEDNPIIVIYKFK